MITFIVRDNGAIKTGMPRRKLYRLQEGLCFYCNEKLPSCYNKNCTVDHLFPRKRTFTKNGNIVLSCATCNVAKGGRLPTVDEVIRASRLYQKHRFGFICEMRLGKPVIRIT